MADKQRLGMGLGLKATRKFEKGEFVIDYAGEYITDYEASEERRKKLMETGHDCYIFSFQVPGSNGKFHWSVTMI